VGGHGSGVVIGRRVADRIGFGGSFMREAHAASAQGVDFPSTLRMRRGTDNPALATGVLASALPFKMLLAIASKVKIFFRHE
jgi:hypothetical protein